MERYWDGTGWTAQTRPASQGGEKQRKKRHVIFPLTFAVFLLATAVIAITMTRSDVEQVDIGGMSVKFRKSDVEGAQSRMEKQLESDRQDAAAKGSSDPMPANDVSGVWNSAQGSEFTWQIQQYGEQVVVREYTPYGITGAGRGVISGTYLTIEFQAFDGSYGRAELELVDESTLKGKIVNLTHNTGWWPLELRR